MKLTRRQVLKIIGVAAAWVWTPGAIGQVKQYQKTPKATPRSQVTPAQGPIGAIQNQFITDRNFRVRMIRNPDEAMAGQTITQDQKNKMKERMEIFTVIGMTLAMQIMKTNRSLRPTLLNGQKRARLLFGDRQEVVNARLSAADVSAVDRVRASLDQIADDIIHVRPDIGMVVGADIGRVGKNDTGCFNNFCEGDNYCNDKGCYDLRCDDSSCGDDTCYDESCSDQSCRDGSCGDDNCKDKSDCNDSSECVKGMIPDAFFERLAIRLETAINRGPDMNFFVRVKSSTIRAQTLLNPNSLRQALPKTTPPG